MWGVLAAAPSGQVHDPGALAHWTRTHREWAVLQAGHMFGGGEKRRKDAGEEEQQVQQYARAPD